MQSLLCIAAGGAIGALLRYFVTEITYKLTNFAVPWGTITVNLIGCFVIGLMWGIAQSFDISNNAKFFIFTGLLGAFTTFSTFALENFNLFRQEEFSLLITNIAVSNVVGILLVFAGFYLSKACFCR